MVFFSDLVNLDKSVSGKSVITGPYGTKGPIRDNIWTQA